MTPARARRAYVIVDLGFGDAGKGLLTDLFARRGATVVVRFNGGAQAGHNVVAPDGRHHTFAQFGAGTLVPGTRTFLARDVVIHPTALFVEGCALAGLGVTDAFERLRVSEGALVVTSFHQALGRMRELARGAGRHGSCGVGVGEAVGDALAHPTERVLTGDLRDGAALARKLRRLRERTGDAARALRDARPGDPGMAREWRAFDDVAVTEAWSAAARQLATRGMIAPDETLTRWAAAAPQLVFEGAQGVLLDERFGFHPFTTWSRCTYEHALALLAEHAPDLAVERIGVLRSHAVRHGPGPLPSETAALRASIVEHNQENPWQGPVRYGWFDAVLARYALDVVGGVDALALTHLDLAERLPGWRACTAYQLATGTIARLPHGPAPTLAGQERLTRRLLAATPLLDEPRSGAAAALDRIEVLLERRVDIAARGPRAGDVHFRTAV